MPAWLVSVASCSSLEVEDKDSLSEELIPFQVLSRREQEQRMVHIRAAFTLYVVHSPPSSRIGRVLPRVDVPLVQSTQFKGVEAACHSRIRR